MRGLLGCCSCGSTTCNSQNVTINTVCPTSASTNANIDGVLVEILDGSTVLDSTTSGGGGIAFLGTVPIPGAGTYTVRASKSGYTTATASISLTCGGLAKNQTIKLCLSTKTLTFTVRTCCPLPGATVAITGDISASGVTDSSGQAVLTVSSPSGCLADITVTVTPPSGYGAAVSVVSRSLTFCSSTYAETITLEPDSNHVELCCDGNLRFLPKVLSWSDDLGTCTLNHGNHFTGLGGNDWYGTYTYASDCIGSLQDCSGTPTCIKTSGTITVGCALLFQSTGDLFACSVPAGECDERIQYRLYRVADEGSGGTALSRSVCGGGQTRGFLGDCVSDGGEAAALGSCQSSGCSGTSISISGSLSLPDLCGEGNVSVTITGTI
jgi:hypothetical protein